METVNPFQKLLRERLAELGISRSELARRLGIWHSTLRPWVEGQGLPMEKHLGCLARVLDVPEGEVRRAWEEAKRD